MRPKSDLRDGQQGIVTRLYENDEQIVVLRPGGGKTVSALTAINELHRDSVIRHALITAPKRVARSVWPDEIAGWEHTRHMRYAVLDGGPKDREARLASVAGREMTIFGHDILGDMLDYLEALPDDHPLFDLLVIDEISRFRNQKGERYKKLIKQVHRWRAIWGLSGTLRPSSGLDLFCPVRLVSRGKMWGRSFYQWQKMWFYPTDYNGYTWDFKPGVEARLNAEIATLVVTAEIPPMDEPTVILDRVELPAAAREQYNKMERRLFAVIGENEDGEKEKVVADTRAIAIGKLAQLASGFMYDGEAVHHLHNEKRDWLKELVENSSEPTLIIYQLAQEFEMMQEVLGGKVPYLGAGVSDKQAAKNIRDWNEGKLPFMGLHPMSGGHGLNLQFGGATEAWISPTWDSEAWDQTIARLHRSGQTKQVIIRVCTATDTVDDLKLERVHNKLSAQAAFEKYLQRVRLLS